MKREPIPNWSQPMYSPIKPPQQVFINNSQPNRTMVVCYLVLSFLAGMAVLRLHQSPETRSQILQMFARGQTAVKVVIHDFALLVSDSTSERAGGVHEHGNSGLHKNCPSERQLELRPSRRHYVYELDFQNCYDRAKTQRQPAFPDSIKRISVCRQ